MCLYLHLQFSSSILSSFCSPFTSKLKLFYPNLHTPNNPNAYYFPCQKLPSPVHGGGVDWPPPTALWLISCFKQIQEITNVRPGFLRFLWNSNRFWLKPSLRFSSFLWQLHQSSKAQKSTTLPKLKLWGWCQQKISVFKIEVRVASLLKIGDLEDYSLQLD